MKNRLLMALVLAVVMVVTSGCSFFQVFFFNVVFEFDYPAKKWVEVFCWSPRVHDVEILPGTYVYNGRIQRIPGAAGGKFPKFVRVRSSILRPDESVMWRRTHKIGFNRKTGEFDETFQYPDLVTIPVGYDYCMEANFRQAMVGGRLEFLNREGPF